MSLFGLEEKPHWADEQLLPFSQSSLDHLLPYRISKYWNSNGSLNVYSVIGTAHPDYLNQSWSWLLENGKRMSRNLLEFQENPSYYTDQIRRDPSMIFISQNGHDWFVDGDGNHRTCIARYYYQGLNRSIIHGVYQTDYRFDYELKLLHEELMTAISWRKLHWMTSVSNTTLKRDDNPGWMRETYKPLIRIKKTTDEYYLNSNQVLELIQSLYSSFWRFKVDLSRYQNTLDRLPD